MSKTNDQRAARALQQSEPDLTYQQALARVRAGREDTWVYRSVVPAEVRTVAYLDIEDADRNRIRVSLDPSSFHVSEDGTWEAEACDLTQMEPFTWPDEDLRRWVRDRFDFWGRDISDPVIVRAVDVLRQAVQGGARCGWTLNDTSVDLGAPKRDDPDDDDGEVPPARLEGLLDLYARCAYDMLDGCVRWSDREDDFYVAEGDERRRAEVACRVASAGVLLLEAALPDNFDGFLPYQFAA